MNVKPTDPVIDEVREVRHRISERFGHDPMKLVAYYLQEQEKYRRRLLGSGVKAASEASAEKSEAKNGVPETDGAEPK